ncbi:MAG: serine hydrolase domain-containing protein [Bryobacteraceae bacterium]|nr:serine hydrolase domain-containing protein [Bryobacteraceae bacterium]
MRRLAALACLVVLPIAAQQFDAAALEKTVREEMTAANIPGAAVAVIQGDRAIFSRAVGTANVESKDPLATNMLFRLGSTTKMFTAAAVVSLAIEGKLSLDEPIGKHIPELPARLAAVTPHQLLSNSAGLRDEPALAGPDDEAALGQMVLSWKDDIFFTQPGRVFSYSNPGYWLAGYLAERVAGKRYADVLRERIFEPVGMKHTTLRPLLAMTYPLAQGHEAPKPGEWRVVRPAVNNAAAWPSGSIFSSLDDLTRFAIAMLNQGRLDGKQVLPERLPSMLMDRGIAVAGSDGMYVYGLMKGKQRGVTVASHGGVRAGYGSLMTFAPEQRVAVIALANRSAAIMGKTANAAAEMLLPFGPPEKDDLKPPRTIVEADFPLYTGLYAQGRMKVEILAEKGKLWLRRESHTMPLTVHEGDEISFTPPGAAAAERANLVRGEGGRVEYLNMFLHALARQ